jgi:hypothetical protein
LFFDVGFYDLPLHRSIDPGFDSFFPDYSPAGQSFKIFSLPGVFEIMMKRKDHITTFLGSPEV